MSAGEKSLPKIDLATLARYNTGHWQMLTGCRKGTVPAALVKTGPRLRPRSCSD